MYQRKDSLMQMLLEVENCSVTSICSVYEMPHIICDIQYATYHMLHLQGFSFSGKAVMVVVTCSHAPLASS